MTGTGVGTGGVTGGHTVLVVDDTGSKRYIIASWLRRAGHRVEEAATGHEALERCGAGGVDLVVLDVHLPDLSGLEVCQRLRAMPSTAAVPVLHISAVAIEVDDRSAGLDQGADAYLVDPIEPRELLSTASALLRYYDARRSAEELAARLGRLVAATPRINAARSVPALLDAAAQGVADVLRAPAVVLGLGEDGAWASAASAPGAATTRAAGPPVQRVGAALERLREPVVVTTGRGGAFEELLPAPEPGRVWSLAPVRGRAGTPIAALAVQAAGALPATQELLVRQLALVVSVALENARAWAAEHRIALTLQRSLLPIALPELAGLAVVARYQASDEEAEVGGDFFDAFELADGTAVVVIGDVQGHSLQAAAIMGELRHSLRAFAREGHTAGSLVDRLNELLLREHPDHTATVVVLAVDASRTRASVVNAGHVPPLLVAGGRAVLLEECSPLLGIEAPTPDPLVLDLEPGTRIVLVTDGLVERRGASLDDGMAALVAAVVAHAGEDLAVLADDLMRTLGSGSEDDRALVAVETALR